MTAPALLGPNDVVPCPSPSARRRHRAHGPTCQVCWPTGLPNPDPASQSRTTQLEEET